MAMPAKPSFQTLTDSLTDTILRRDEVSKQLSEIYLKIRVMSQQFYSDANKLHCKITKVQLSRPRGSQANQWPHCPMSLRVQQFYQAKDIKERALWTKKDNLRRLFDHEKAILTSQTLQLENLILDYEAKIRQLNIQINRH